MNLDVDDTIAAIASAQGNSLRGIIRISGPATIECLTNSFRFIDHQSISVWLSSLNSAAHKSCRIDLKSNAEVDAELLVWPTNRSYTRQVSAEIHTPGSPAILQMLLSQLLRGSCRIAEPGEFTMRAFLAGRLDLTQAEAVIGVIDSKNRKQFDNAFAQLAGGIGGPISEARDLLIGILAELEAGLDFVEEDIEFISQQHLLEQLNEVSRKIGQVSIQIEKRHQSSERVSVVLSGRPNAGKSSLFNALSGADAIVSDIQGTTRDYIKAEMEIDGIPIVLIDTAGVDDSSEEIIEQMMTSQADTQIKAADICVRCIESLDKMLVNKPGNIDGCNDSTIVAWTKCDLPNSLESREISGIKTSSLESTGVEILKSKIAELANEIRSESAGIVSTISRTSANLKEAAGSVDRAIDAAAHGLGEEIVAVEIRTALDHLGHIAGTIYTDDILDQVFSRFCIGK